MQYAPRTIAWICDLFHPAIETDAGPIQKVHNHLFQSSEPIYTSFAVTPTGAVLSNPVARQGAVSQVSFLTDRFQFREELSGLTMEEFAARVATVAAMITEKTKVQVFTAQHVTIRTLVNPRNFRDSRAFLKRGMFGFAEETTVLGREPHLYGIRMMFPPTEQEPNAYALRIESYNSDSRSLFLENQASYPPILVARGLSAVGENIENSYRFLVDRALDFVGRFDVRQEA